MSNLLDEMESDVTTPTIGDNSLKEMADLCAEQASLEEEMRQLEEQLKAKAKAQRKNPLKRRRFGGFFGSTTGLLCLPKENCPDNFS